MRRIFYEEKNRVFKVTESGVSTNNEFYKKEAREREREEGMTKRE